MRDPENLAETLLELHLQHELDALTGKPLMKNLRAEIRSAFTFMKRMTLREAVTPEAIMATIRRNVIDLEIPPGIPDLAGHMARRIYASPEHQNTTLSDLISEQQVEEFIDEIMGLREQRERLVNHMLDHPLYAELASNILYHGIVNYIYEENLLSRSVPGVAPMMKFGKRMFNRAIPGLDETLERSLKAYISRNLHSIVRQSQSFLTHAMTDAQVRDSAREIWAQLADRSLAGLQEGMSEVELSEFVLLGYEFWLDFRKTPYFEHCCQLVVDQLFERYGETSLAELAKEFGLTPDRIIREAQNYLPPLMRQLREKGYLEAMLRRRLEPFYRSSALIEALARQ